MKSVFLMCLVLLMGCMRPAVQKSMPTREEVYPELMALAEQLGKAGPDERPAIFAQIKKRLPSWYGGIDVAPPDTSDPKWTTIVGYDLLPDAEFEKRVKATRKLFQELGKPFPKQVTRRDLLRLIEGIMKEM